MTQEQLRTAQVWLEWARTVLKREGLEEWTARFSKGGCMCWITLERIDATVSASAEARWSTTTYAR